jgi:phosphomannomutase
LEEYDQETKKKGIVIGYDGRYNSEKFARLTAAVFVAKNFKVYLYPHMVPTPFVVRDASCFFHNVISLTLLDI